MMYGEDYMMNEDEDTEEQGEVDQDELIKFSELALSSNVSIFSTSSSSSASTSPCWSNNSSLSTSTSSIDSSSLDYFSHISPESNKFPAADVDVETNLPFGEEDRSATPTNLSHTKPISLFNPAFSFSTSISNSPLADQNSSFFPAAPAYTSRRSLPTTRHPTRPSSPSPPLSPSGSTTLTTTSSLMTRSFSTPVATQKSLDESRVLLGVVGSQMGARAKRVLSLSSTSSSSPLLSASPSGCSSTDDLDRFSTNREGGAMERTYSNSSLGVETNISKSFRTTIKSLPATPLRRPSIETIELDKDNALVFPYNLIARPSRKGERRASHYSSSKSRQSSVPALSTSAPATSNSLQYSIGSLDSEERPTMKRRTTLLNPLTKIVAESFGENGRRSGLVRTSTS
jgi:hypothetical protein